MVDSVVAGESRMRIMKAMIAAAFLLMCLSAAALAVVLDDPLTFLFGGIGTIRFAMILYGILRQNSRRLDHQPQSSKITGVQG